MTWNLQRGQAVAGRLALAEMAPFAARIENNRADVVGLQEVTRDQAAALTGLLGWGSPHYVETKAPCPTSQPPLPGACVPFGNAILSRYPLSRPGEWALPASVEEAPTEKRVLLRSVIAVGGSELSVYATHLASEATTAERTAQAAVISDLVDQDGRTTGDDGFRPVLVGDFNADPTSDVIALVTDRFADAWAEAGVDDAGFTSNSTLGLDRRIDYVLVGRRGLRITAASVDREVLSDHLSVVAEVNLGAVRPAAG